MSLIAAFAVNTANAGELQWRKAGPKRHSPSADAQPISRSKSMRRQDGAVRQVAFEADELAGPSFGAQQAASTTMRSVVVNREDVDAGESSAEVRSAQLEFRPPSEAPDTRYTDEINRPFGDQPTETESTEMELDEEIALPPTELPEADLTPPSNELTLPDATERQPPRTFEPAPPTEAPRPDPFVEADEEPDAGLPPADDQTLADEGDMAEADCEKELEKLKASTLHDVDLNIVVTGDQGVDFPFECSIDDGQWHAGRAWCETTYMWKASALCHKPLYFEDEALERYGHSWGPCLDPLVSGAHFFCKLPVLPYCMGVTPPCECVYALGHYRPGSCAPYMIDPVPISCRGAVLQAGAVVGAAAILP
jgi:hypothetical protein